MIRILWVEDAPDEISFALNEIERLGYEYEYATSRKMAAEILDKGLEFDLIILDVSMQEDAVVTTESGFRCSLSGLELYRELRSGRWPFAKDVLVRFVTNHKRIVEGKLAGEDAPISNAEVIGKPLTDEKLRDLIPGARPAVNVAVLDRLEVGEAAELEVAIESLPELAPPFGRPATELEICVKVHSVDAEVSPRAQKVRVSRLKAAVPLLFEVKPRSLGDCLIEVEVYSMSDRVGYVTLGATVEPAAHDHDT